MKTIFCQTARSIESSPTHLLIINLSTSPMQTNLMEIALILSQAHTGDCISAVLLEACVLRDLPLITCKQLLISLQYMSPLDSSELTLTTGGLLFTCC